MHFKCLKLYFTPQCGFSLAVVYDAFAACMEIVHTVIRIEVNSLFSYYLHLIYLSRLFL